MKTADSKTTAAAPVHQAQQGAFFQGKEAQDGFFESQQTVATPFFQPSAPVIQAKCATCEQEEKVQKKQEEETQPKVQTKLKIGAPDDHYEKQADAIADKVVQRMAAPTPAPSADQEEKLQRKEEEVTQTDEQVQMKPIFDSAIPPDDNTLQRKCADCEKEESGKVQRKESGGESTASPDISSRLSASKGGGSPLPDTTRTQMESAMGADFSGVRIHTGSEAAGMSNDIQAQAFTHGSDVYFNEGKYSPGSSDGQRLLAHELVHTVQQGGSHASPTVAKKENNNIDIAKAPDTSGSIQRGILGSAWDATGGRVIRAGEALYDMGADALKSLINRIAPGLITFLQGDIIGFIKGKISSAIDILTGGLFSRIQTEGFASVLIELLGAGFSSIGSNVAEGCAAVANVAKKLWAFAKKLAGPAIQVFKSLMQKIGSFLSGLWNDFGKPAWEGIKHYAGEAWDWVVEKATWIWDKTQPIRDTIGRAWNWLKRQFGIAWGNAVSVLDWLKQKATAAWIWIKAKIQPIIGPLKAIGAILVMISPAGPIIAIYKAAPYVWRAIKWLASNFNKHVIIKAKDFFFNEILPAIQNGLSWLQSAIGGAMSWLGEKFNALGAAVGRVLNAIGSIAVFRAIRSGIERVSRGIRSGINYVVGKALGFASWVRSTAAKIWRKLAPLKEFLRQLILMSVLGPLSILDDGVWNTLKHIMQFALTVPCVKEIGELIDASGWIDRIDNFRQSIKFAWHLLTHPEELQERVRIFLEPYIQTSPDKAHSQVTSLLASHGISSARHLAGILRHLNPAISHLLSNWWTEAKKMIWFLIWPFAEGSPIYTDAPKLWNLLPQIWGDLWSGNFRRVRDGFLEWWQALNMVVGAFAGWIAMGGAIVGAIIGAFAGGVGAAPGAGIGFEIGVLIGEGILVSMIANEMLIIDSALSDLATVSGETPQDSAPATAQRTTPAANATTAEGEQGGQLHSGDIHTNEQRIEYAYQRIANSALTLGIMLALVVLGAIGGKIASAITSGLKKVGTVLAEKFPNAAQSLRNVGEGIRESNLGRSVGEAVEGFDRGREMVRQGEAFFEDNSDNKMSTGTKKGLDSTPESIREGTVRMEEHPDYNTAISEIQNAGFEIKYSSSSNVQIYEIIDKQGNHIRFEKTINLQKGMRYLDLEHEIGHMRQAIERFGDNQILITERYVELPNGMRKKNRSAI